MSYEKELRIKVNPWYVAIVFILLGISMFLWATRPLWHSIVFFFYMNPLPWMLFGFAIAVTGWAVAGGDYDHTPWGRWAVAVAVWLALLLLLPCTGALTRVYIAAQMSPEVITQLPETERVRFVPIEVAETLAQNKQEDSRLAVGDMDPIDFNGNFLWVAPRVPNGFVNSFVHRMDGFMVVDEDTNLTVVRQSFRFGEGMLLHHWIGWQLLMRDYWAKYPEFFYLPVETDGGYLGVAPYIGYRFQFPVQVPYWAGVMVFHSDGTIEDLTVEQALSDSRFEGQRLFPEELARYQAASWAYKEGILNAWFTHHDQVEIPRLVHSENQMPYLLPGNIWMIAAEPTGPSQSVFKIFFFDAHTGSLKLYELDPDHAMIGPNVAWGYAKAGTQAGYVWAESGEGGTYLIIEPRPAINDGALRWMYTVTVRQQTGISLTILVGGQDEVLHFCSRRSLERWLEGVGGSDPIPCGQPTSLTSSETEVPLDDLSAMSDDELLNLLRRIIDELERRR